MHVWKGKYDPYDTTIYDEKHRRRRALDHLFEYKKNYESDFLKAIKEHYRDVDG